MYLHFAFYNNYVNFCILGTPKWVHNIKGGNSPFIFIAAVQSRFGQVHGRRANNSATPHSN
jgi:hypothetical protein